MPHPPPNLESPPTPKMAFPRSQAISPSTASSSTAPSAPSEPTSPPQASPTPTIRLGSEPAPPPTDPPPSSSSSSFSPGLAANTPSTTDGATRPNLAHRTWTADDLNTLVVLKLFGRLDTYRALADHWNVVRGSNAGGNDVSGKAIYMRWKRLAGTADEWRIGWWRDFGKMNPVVIKILEQAGVDVQTLSWESDVEDEVGGGRKMRLG